MDVESIGPLCERYGLGAWRARCRRTYAATGRSQPLS
jgi:hypothetical protein